MGKSFADIVYQFTPLINGVITLLSAVAILVFFAGIVRYMFAEAAGKAKKEGKELIGWGLVALFVLFAVGGIVNFLARDLFGTSVLSGGTTGQTNSPGDAFVPADNNIQFDSGNSGFY